MSLRSGFLVLLCIVCITVTALSADDKPKNVKFISESGKFSVIFPENPVEQTHKIDAPGAPLNFHLFIVDQKDRAFLSGYVDYPTGTVTDKNVQAVLDGIRDGNVKGVKGKLFSEKKITFNKKHYPGREVLIEFSDAKLTYRGRFFLVGDRLYQVIATGPSEFTKGEIVDSYLNSFQLEE